MALIKNLFLILFSSLAFYACTDKNLEDYHREQLQNQISRISAISGSYSGDAISQVDGQKLGAFNLEFKPKTDVQTSTSNASGQQIVAVSGSISLVGAISAKISFDNGFYDDVTGDFQATVPVVDSQGQSAKLALKGSVSGDMWQGTIEILGQTDYGAKLILNKNMTVNNSGRGETTAIRIQDVKNLNILYIGEMKIGNEIIPVKLRFLTQEMLPSQKLYSVLSPYTQIVSVLDFGYFQLTYENAFIDDYLKTISARDPVDQRGVKTRANLQCSKFINNTTDFGWNCVLETKNGFFQTHLKASI